MWLAQAASASSIDKAAVKEVIAAHRAEIRECYERALVAKPELHGKVTVRFLIAPSGKVKSTRIAESTASNAPLERCLVERVGTWVFAKHTGDDLQITYPFVFALAEEPREAPHFIRDAAPNAKVGWRAVWGTLRGMPGCERGCSLPGELASACAAFAEALIRLEDGQPLEVVIAPLQREVVETCCDEVFDALQAQEHASLLDRYTIWCGADRAAPEGTCGAARCPAVERFWLGFERRFGSGVRTDAGTPRTLAPERTPTSPSP